MDVPQNGQASRPCSSWVENQGHQTWWAGCCMSCMPPPQHQSARWLEPVCTWPKVTDIFRRLESSLTNMHRFIYTLFLALDVCFCLKWEEGPCSRYRTCLLCQGCQVSQLPSHHHWSKGDFNMYRVSCPWSCKHWPWIRLCNLFCCCAMHELIEKNGVGYLQKSERSVDNTAFMWMILAMFSLRYANIDYICQGDEAPLNGSSQSHHLKHCLSMEYLPQIPTQEASTQCQNCWHWLSWRSCPQAPHTCTQSPLSYSALTELPARVWAYWWRGDWMHSWHFRALECCYQADGSWLLSRCHGLPVEQLELAQICQAQ